MVKNSDWMHVFLFQLSDDPTATVSDNRNLPNQAVLIPYQDGVQIFVKDGVHFPQYCVSKPDDRKRHSPGVHELHVHILKIGIS